MRLEWREGSLAGSADKHTRAGEQTGSTLGGWMSKPVQVGEKITTVDGINREGLCQFFGWIMTGGRLVRWIHVWGLVWGFGARRVAPGRLSAVYDNMVT